MRLLTIDPSLTCTGYAVWDIRGTWEDNTHALIHYGCIRTDIKESDESRLGTLRKGIRGVLETHDISLVVYEKPTAITFKNKKGGYRQNLKYRQAVENVRVVCEDYFLGERKHVIGVTVGTWKGTGKKKDTINKVNMCFGLELKARDNDIADAIGLGVWFLDRQRFAPIDYTFTG